MGKAEHHGEGLARASPHTRVRLWGRDAASPVPLSSWRVGQGETQVSPSSLGSARPVNWERQKMTEVT